MNKLPTRLALIQLDMVCSELKSETKDNDLRIGELNNLQAIVRGAIDALLEDDEDFAVTIMAEVAPRISDLADNPKSAGKHDLINIVYLHKTRELL